MYPDDLQYSSKHEWVRQGAGGTVRIGNQDYEIDALAHRDRSWGKRSDTAPSSSSV